MSRGQSSSSCSHNSRVMRNQSSCCSSGGCRGLGEVPTCNCGVAAVLRTTITIKNGGRQFWGCPNFKVVMGAISLNGALKMVMTKRMQLF
ncbi:hypothetical protein DEO72_LG3g537 [Vigna unguiculata]|uniref:GRF-type domain-containing protein n=1 Tax=Vigna unguiculata TaxID=3917 RepID=A0A4D6LC77_VIGUN|nr:hypothetical protein DEO72_LG3g537 [Vigna unguiculata]